MLKNALAYAELKTGNDIKFAGGTLEFDGTKTAIDRSSSETENTHCGRLLVCYHRESGNYGLLPLKNKSVVKGGAPPPETILEVEPYMVKKLKSKHIAATDGGKAFVSVGK